MIQLNFLNAVAEDNGDGLVINGKEVQDIISAALGTIKEIPTKYKYLGEKNKTGRVFSSELCNISITIDDRQYEKEEKITFSYKDIFPDNGSTGAECDELELSEYIAMRRRRESEYIEKAEQGSSEEK